MASKVALRGRKQHLNKLKDETKNPGHFLSMAKILATYCSNLHENVMSHSSPHTQNVVGNHILISDLVQEIKTAQFYSMADEVATLNSWLCVFGSWIQKEMSERSS